MTLEWNGAEILVEMDKACDAGIQAAGETLAATIRKNLNRQGTPTSDDERSDLARGNKLFGSVVSKLSKTARRALRLAESIRDLGGFVDPPGGMPRKRSGFLQKSFVMEMDGRDALVGSDMVYARIHEFGGVHIPARPYVRPSIVESKQEMANNFTVAARRSLGEGTP